eukprot:CAMPEP_0114237396 /NCGR_PEP_ID=MMETSP0058-20121206/7366_1 /TAXON_ID=36894 /ORGANISM="Pyramimonas parkeae, CCMP726" /LENGTH=174 /DNA_ID=CAMNT_0001349431 /DNA_START=281 /DNA_END=805 /DNA_ORIENTATION=-
MCAGFSCREESLLAAEETAARLDTEAARLTEQLCQDELWESGIRPLQAELHERVPMVEHACANLETEVQRAQRQVEYNKALCAMYPDELDDEKKKIMAFGEYDLTRQTHDLNEARNERRLVLEAKCAMDKGAIELARRQQQGAAQMKAVQWKKEMIRERYYHCNFQYDWTNPNW